MSQPIGPAQYTTAAGLAEPTPPHAVTAPQQEPAPNGIGGPTTPGFRLLLVSAPQLSGDGQLRELIEERRSRFGDRADLWYLSPAGVHALALGNPGEEAVVAADPAVITWLQLRFGGRIGPVSLGRAELQASAAALPARLPQAPLAWG
jgi:hypothetical protein